MRFVATSIDIPAAGTQVQLSSNANFAAKDRILWISFKARLDFIYIGDADVSSTDGFELAAADDPLIFDFRLGDKPGSVTADSFWVDADTNGDDVDVAAIIF